MSSRTVAGVGVEDIVLALPVGVAEDGAVRPDDVAKGGEQAVGAADDRTDLAQRGVDQNRIARHEAERSEISGEGAAGGRRQLAAPA